MIWYQYGPPRTPPMLEMAQTWPSGASPGTGNDFEPKFIKKNWFPVKRVQESQSENPYTRSICRKRIALVSCKKYRISIGWRPMDMVFYHEWGSGISSLWRQVSSKSHEWCQIWHSWPVFSTNQTTSVLEADFFKNGKVSRNNSIFKCIYQTSRKCPEIPGKRTKSNSDFLKTTPSSRGFRKCMVFQV